MSYNQSLKSEKSYTLYEKFIQFISDVLDRKLRLTRKDNATSKHTTLLVMMFYQSSYLEIFTFITVMKASSLNNLKQIFVNLPKKEYVFSASE